MTALSELSRISDLLDPPPIPYVDEPVEWVQTRLKEFIWSKQRDVLNSLVDHRYTAVRSAHDTGKSFIAARAAAWWIGVHPPGEAFVVTTAPTAAQVEAILWREIGRAHRQGGLAGRLTGGSIPSWKLDTGELVAYGRKPADYDQSAFQGIHARYVLVIMDEAGGIPRSLYDAVDTLATNESARVLAIGNPDDPTSHFEKVCRPGSGWNVIHISAFDTPAFTMEAVPGPLLEVLVSSEWVEERRQRWGESSPLYVSKVLGQFPEIGEDALITPAMLRTAYNNDLSSRSLVPGCYGVDIARMGRDETAVYRNRGGVVRLERTWAKKDTMQTAGMLIELIAERLGEVPAVLDVIGVGAGPYDRLREQGYPVVAFNAAEKANDSVRFVNRRAEQWWEVRTLFEDGELDLDERDEELANEFLAIKWKVTSSGRIFMESKDETSKVLGRSPDRADAFMMSTFVGAEWAAALGLTHRDSERDRKAARKYDLTSGLLEEAL